MSKNQIKIKKQLYKQIDNILNNGVIHIDQLIEELNSNNSTKILEKDVIIELYEYSNLFYYLDGLIISLNNEEFIILRSLIIKIEILLRKNLNLENIAIIVIYLLFFKRLSDLDEKSRLLNYLDKNDFFKSLKQILYSIEHKNQLQFNLTNTFLSFVENISEEILFEIFDILKSFNSLVYNKKFYAKVILGLFKDNIQKGEHYSNYSLNRLISKLLDTENNVTIFDPFGGLGELLIEVSSNNLISYIDINENIVKIAYMNMFLFYEKNDFSIYLGNAFNSYNNGIIYDYIFTQPPFALNSKENRNYLSSILKEEGLDFKAKNNFELLCSIFVLSKMKKKGAVLFPQSFFKRTVDKEFVKYLLDNDYIETIIELPSILPNTEVKTSLVIFNKNKDIRNKGKIKFINAPLLLKHHKLNYKSYIDIDFVVSAYLNKSSDFIDIEYKQIIENNYILQIQLYSKEIYEFNLSLEKGETYRLKDIVSIITSKINLNGKRKEYTIIGRSIISIDNGIPIVKSNKDLKKDISNIFLDMNALEKIETSKVKLSDIIATECILIVKRGIYLSPTIFKPTEKNPQIVISNNIYALIPKKNLLLEYLYYQLYENLEKQILYTSLGSVNFPIDLYKRNIEKIIIPKKNLEEQEKYIERYRQDIINKELKKIEEKFCLIGYTLNKSLKPLIITEGKTDKKILETAWKKLYNIEMPFEIKTSGTSEIEGSADLVKRTLELDKHDKRIIIGVFDNDREGNEQFKGLKNSIFEKYNIESSIRKHLRKNIYALILPIPNFRKLFVTKDDIQQRYFSIEHYFSNEILEKYNIKGKSILGTKVFKISGNKNKFSQKIEKLNKKEFKYFELLFDKINRIINNSKEME